MGLEDLTGADKFIDDLVNTNPTSSDAPSQGDDHIRGVKNVLGNCFAAITGAVTSTHTELNLLDGVTSTTAELNILDGVTSTAAELNILDGVTSTAAELNILDGVTATTAELNYVDVTAAGTAQASKAMILNGSKTITGITSLTSTTLAATTYSAGALANGMTATTQSASDNSTKVATTAYVDAAAGAVTHDDITWSLTTGGQWVISGSTQVVPAGLHIMVDVNGSSTAKLEVYQGGAWRTSVQIFNGGTILSDGTNVRLNGIGSFYYRRLA